MKIRSNTFEMGDAIPERCAYGRKGASGETVRSENLNPHLAWSDAPEGTKAFVLACLDDDVPTSREPSALDAAGEIPASQARRRFVHWVQANVPADVTDASTVAYMRQASKNIMYTVVSSWAYEDGDAQAGLPVWQMVLIGVDVAIAAALIGCEVATLRSYRRRLAEHAK